MHKQDCLMRKNCNVKAALSVLAATLLFTSCSKLAEYGKTNTNTQPAEGATPAPGQARVATTPALPTGAPPVSAGPAIATADGDMPGIRVEVQELKRNSGGTVTLKFAMINDSDKDLSFGYSFGDPDYSIKDYGGIGGVHLIDAVGKKKYFVARDTDTACLCSRSVPTIDAKSRANLWAKFPAPPEDVQKITVVIPHFTPMDDVSISR